MYHKENHRRNGSKSTLTGTVVVDASILHLSAVYCLLRNIQIHNQLQNRTKTTIEHQLKNQANIQQIRQLSPYQNHNLNIYKTRFAQLHNRASCGLDGGSKCTPGTTDECETVEVVGDINPLKLPLKIFPDSIQTSNGPA